MFLEIYLFFIIILLEHFLVRLSFFFFLIQSDRWLQNLSWTKSLRFIFECKVSWRCYLFYYYYFLELFFLRIIFLNLKTADLKFKISDYIGCKTTVRPNLQPQLLIQLQFRKNICQLCEKYAIYTL